MEFQVSYLKSLKMMLWKCHTQYVSKFGKLSSGHRTGKGQFSFQFNSIPTQTIVQLHSFPRLARLCSKSFKVGWRSMWTENFYMYQVDLEKAEEQEIKLPTLIISQRKQGNFRKTSTSASLTTLKPLCWSQQTVESSSRDGNNRPPDLPPEKSICSSRSNN